jgi:hypothetical protein
MTMCSSSPRHSPPRSTRTSEREPMLPAQKLFRMIKCTMLERRSLAGRSGRRCGFAPTSHLHRPSPHQAAPTPRALHTFN